MGRFASGVRVACRIPNASHRINGVRFGTAGENLMVSEPIADDIAAAFCRNPDFAVEGFDDDVLERVDADIAANAAAPAESAQGLSGADAQLVDELRRANAAQAVDIDRMQVEVAELRVKVSRSNAQEVARLEARVAELEAQKGGGDSSELAGQVAQLTEELGAERRASIEGGARLEQLREEHRQVVLELSGKLDQATKGVEALTADKTRLDGEVASAREAAMGLESDVTTLRQANEGLAGDVQRLTDELALAKENVEQLTKAAETAAASGPGKSGKAKS